MNFKLKIQKRKFFLIIQNIKTKEICFNGMVNDLKSAFLVINQFHETLIDN